MALNYDIINNKKTITNVSNEEYIDLLSDSYNYDETASGQFLIVNKHYVARPDLISLAVYQDDKYADLICKVNSISNPFEMAEDTVLFIPDIETLQNYSNAAKQSSDLIDDTNNDVLSNVSIGNQKRRSEQRTSNEQVIGEQNYVIDKSLGIVFY